MAEQDLGHAYKASKENAGYGDHKGTRERHCGPGVPVKGWERGDCRFFWKAGGMTCHLVSGKIMPQGSCMLWEKKV